jgi:ferrous iron transport protein A
MNAVLSLSENDTVQQLAARLRLTQLATMVDARIVAIVAPDVAGGAEIPERLGELGFFVGERVRVLARAPFGDPIAVRVGSGTFALRCAEADCVQVEMQVPASR